MQKVKANRVVVESIEKMKTYQKTNKMKRIGCDEIFLIYKKLNRFKWQIDLKIVKWQSVANTLTKQSVVHCKPTLENAIPQLELAYI